MENKEFIPGIINLLNPAAEDVKIIELENIIGEKIPEDFRELYLWHNGESESVSGVMAGFRWMSIDSVIREWGALQESAYEIISDKDGLIKEGKYKKGWVPFAEDGGGSFIVMDLDPGDKGTYGQIITIDRDSDISYVISENLKAFLDFIRNNFKDGNIKTWQDDDIKVIQWKEGHLFDDIITLTGGITEKDSFPVYGFWAEYFKDEVVNGSISAEILERTSTVFIKADMGEKYGKISLDIVKHMKNLKELIIHADEISSFEPIKSISSLVKLVILSKCFIESDLEYVAEIEKLKQLTLVKLSINDLSILKNIKTIKCLRLCKLNLLNISSIGYLKNLEELSLEEMMITDLSFISSLTKLRKLEINEVDMQNLKFLQGLKKLRFFETDRKAKDESDIDIFEEMESLEELIYPIGDIKIVKNNVNLKSLGVDASNLEALEYLRDMNITNITVFNAESEEHAESIIAKIQKYCKLQSYGWQETWNCE